MQDRVRKNIASGSSPSELEQLAILNNLIIASILALEQNSSESKLLDLYRVLVE